MRNPEMLLGETLHIVAGPEDEGMRLDKFLSVRVEELTRSAAERLAEQGQVSSGGKTLDKKYRLRAGDAIEVILPEPVGLDILPEAIPLDIRYEDADLLVVNKPKGMVVHPAAGHAGGTLVNALLAHCGDSLSGINGVIRPGIVHRIDKDTSGLLIVAKNDFAHQRLAEQIKEHSFTRMYEAVVHGNLKEDTGTVDAPIGRHPTDRKRMAVTEKNSRHAVTHFEVLARYKGFTHVRLKLETGRTHQIRVHMAYIGHPVAGDPVYGPKKPVPNLDGQCLHARVIGFVHPRTGEYLEITSELPSYFTAFLEKLKKQTFGGMECGLERDSSGE
ncbi:RluA family pseudouridine synthase [Anaeromassilibacillus sp. 1001302B_160321_C8]|uniref:RluA family pseudouridine synthase n=1 Tax=Anaeromassilibacillus sp. 1001302B_160321_C8 TaxID=2787132 RepID=UPI003FA4BCF2